MNKTFASLGWVFALIMLGALVTSGFRQDAMKFGYVDLERVIADSQLKVDLDAKLTF